MNLQNRELIPVLCKHNYLLIPLLESSCVFEFVGTKWILEVPFEKFTKGHLAHCKDEISHGLSLKEQIWKLRLTLTDEELKLERYLSDKFIKATEFYITKLLTRSYKLLLRNGLKREDAVLAGYVYSSYLIEMRILKNYPLIIKHTENNELQKVLGNILKDEHEHISIVKSFWKTVEELSEAKFEEFKLIEEEIAVEMYSDFLNEINVYENSNLLSHTWS